MFTGNYPASARTMTYREVGASTAIDGASSHKLVSLLYAGLLSEITSARGAMKRGDIPAKGKAISKAVRLIEEGLKAPLDMEAGGEIAANLNRLYEYLVMRLTMANIKSDDGSLLECWQLIDTLRDGWDRMVIGVNAHEAVAA